MSKTKTKPCGPVTLLAETAAQMMTPNPLSIHDTASVREAVGFFIDKGISGAPVIDEAGRPVGVLTQTDLLVYDRQKVEHVTPSGMTAEESETGAPLPKHWWKEFQIENVDTTPVRDLMTPAVFSVAAHTPAHTVIEEMRDLNVHRLFVVDANGVLVGVISALDVLRQLNIPKR